MYALNGGEGADDVVPKVLRLLNVMPGTSDGTLQTSCTSEFISELLTCTAQSIARGKHSDNNK
jgi:hypothetical protein